MRPHLAAVALACVAILPACTTTQSTRAKALTPTALATAQTVRDCRTLAVLPFAQPAGKRVDPAAGAMLAQDVARRLGNDFGQLFDAVEFTPSARGTAGECVLRGEITRYRKGSRVVRFVFFGGVGSASLEGRIAVADATGAPLLEAPFDKLWAWGGVTGASKGMGDMQAELGASIAATVARAKGWTPPPKP